MSPGKKKKKRCPFVWKVTLFPCQHPSNHSILKLSSVFRDLMDNALWILLSVFMLCCEGWRTFQTSKVILSTKCNCNCDVMKFGSFSRTQQRKQNPQTQGPTMYTSATVCSLCIVELQRHSELVNGAITSNNNLSYLTKTLSLCHWMCFMSNKKKMLCQTFVSRFFSRVCGNFRNKLEQQKKASSFQQGSVSLLSVCVCVCAVILTNTHS